MPEDPHREPTPGGPLASAPLPASAWSETLAVAVGLGVVMAVAVVANRATGLFTRPLWLDEYHTWLLATDPSFAHALAALRRGADFNPPGYFLLLRGYTALTGPPSEVTLRAFALGSVLLGLVGLHRLLRRSFESRVALVGVLAVATHPMLIRQAFDGRFYAPWFAATAWLCLLLGRGEPAGRRSIPATLGVAILSGLICAIHYFGIIALTLIAAFHLPFQARGPGSRRRSLVGLAAGPATLAVLIPLFYFGQKATLSVPTWIAPPTPSGVCSYLGEIFPIKLFGLAGLVGAGAEMIQRRTAEIAAPEGPGRSLTPLLGVMGLVLLPFAIVALSYLVQPSTVTRYALPAVLCVGPIIAVLLERTPRWLLVLWGVGLVGVVALRVRTEVGDIYRLNRDQLRGGIAAIERDWPGQRLVVSPLRKHAFSIWRYAPALRDRVRMLDLSDEYQGTDFNFHRLERDVATRLSQLYGTPRVITRDAIPDTEPFYLIASKDDADRVAGRFPHHQRADLAIDGWVVMRLTPEPAVRRPPEAGPPAGHAPPGPPAGR